jgi:small GTP-binding protein
MDSRRRRTLLKFTGTHTAVMATRPLQAARDGIPSVKLVLLGQSSVGKTSIMTVANDGDFIPDQSATVGACFHVKMMKVGDTPIKFHIWDTAGQEQFRALTPMYYRDAQFALLVYAINDHNTFDDVTVVYADLLEDCSPLPHIVLVGNKIDLVGSRQVTLEEGRALAKRLSAQFFEVSAKATLSIHRMMEEIAIEAVQYFGGAAASRDWPVANSGNSGCCR